MSQNYSGLDNKHPLPPYEECTCTNLAHGGKLWKCATKECSKWDGLTAKDLVNKWLRRNVLG